MQHSTAQNRRTRPAGKYSGGTSRTCTNAYVSVHVYVRKSVNTCAALTAAKSATSFRPSLSGEDPDCEEHQQERKAVKHQTPASKIKLLLHIFCYVQQHLLV